MSKKPKKAEKGPPKDEFDPLLVESSQAATVVLMLDCSEEEILSKACEAIYKFVEKWDVNKKQLLDLGCLSPLMRLIQHENKTIRRNACMALGSLSQHPDAARALKKSEDVVPSLLKLLSPDEDPVVHEYAAQCLLALSNFYSGKCMILEQNGVDALVRCLTSTEPDVQNNALQTLVLLLQDQRAKSKIRELNAFQPMLDLLQSEYPSIQCNALLALELATQEVANRTALKDLDGVSLLTEFIGNPKFSSLHCFAVGILSNCLDDVETIKSVKESGVLSRLVAFVTDTAPPSLKVEEKKGKKDAKAPPAAAASRGGKKGKDMIDDDDEDMDSDDDKGKGKKKVVEEEGPVVFQPTIAPVKEHVCWTIARAAKNAEIRKLLHEEQIEKMLIQLLDYPGQEVRIAASQAIHVMSENLLSREFIGKSNGILSLVRMIRDDSHEIHEAAITALSILTTMNDFNCGEISKHRGIEPLIKLLSCSEEMTLVHTCITLTNLAPTEYFRTEILDSGLIPALNNPLSSPCECPSVQLVATSAVIAFVLEPDDRCKFIESGGLKLLVGYLESSNDDVRRHATQAVCLLAIDEMTAKEICRLGGLDYLRFAPMNSYTEAALQHLLDNNLSAKFAICGKLCHNNLITDGFYDVGPLKAGVPFRTIGFYIDEPVNKNRPILLVNTRETITPVSNAAEDVECGGCQHSPCCCGVKSGPPGCPVVPEPTLCCDTQLVSYLEELNLVMEKMECCSLKERAIYLAKYVACKMGGDVEKAKMVNFSWELPISQLKFETKSNVLLIGSIKTGTYNHRALLFKVLGDRLGIASSLVRSENHRTWNELFLDEDQIVERCLKFPPKPFIIDLMHEPGRLMRTDSAEAAEYRKV